MFGTRTEKSGFCCSGWEVCSTKKAKERKDREEAELSEEARIAKELRAEKEQEKWAKNEKERERKNKEEAEHNATRKEALQAYTKGARKRQREEEESPAAKASKREANRIGKVNTLIAEPARCFERLEESLKAHDKGEPLTTLSEARVLFEALRDVANKLYVAAYKLVPKEKEKQ